jgi:hypothetical protein
VEGNIVQNDSSEAKLIEINLGIKTEQNSIEILKEVNPDSDTGFSYVLSAPGQLYIIGNLMLPEQFEIVQEQPTETSVKFKLYVSDEFKKLSPVIKCSVDNKEYK